MESHAALTLTLLPGIDRRSLYALYRKLGSAAAVLEAREDWGDILPALATTAPYTDDEWDNARREADAARQRSEASGIRLLLPADAAYPVRLARCEDAPLVLHVLGPADLNAARAVSIVGTRHASGPGRDRARRLVCLEHDRDEHTLIVSGLAYGIDIEAHRAALALSMPTVAVLAHGLQTIYPAQHRPEAALIARSGALVSEYPIGTPARPQRFLERDRIIAALSDRTIVAESRGYGGSIVTARLAAEYGREVSVEESVDSAI